MSSLDTAIDPLITASVPGDTRSDPVDLKRIIDREKSSD